MPKSSVNENAVATASEVLTQALALLGPNGEHWEKSVFWKDGCGNFCVGGAIREFAGNRWISICTLVEEAAGTPVWLWSWNDESCRTFPEVKAAFEKAIALAKESEAA